MLYEARLLRDDTVCVPTQSCQEYIPSPSLIILTTHYHADTMLTSSLDVLHILWYRLGSSQLDLNLKNIPRVHVGQV